MVEKVKFTSIKGLLNSISISLYSFLKVRDSLVLVVMGIALLSIGLDGVSKAQNLGEATPDGWPLAASLEEGAPSATNNLSEGAPTATHQLAPGATAQLAPGSFNSFVAEASPNFSIAQQSLAFGTAEATPFLGAIPLINGVQEEVLESTLADELDPDFDDTLIRNSVGNLFRLIEGAFGALLVVGAGIAAIIAGVVGAYKAAFALFVTAIGAFILRAYVSLFFGTDYASFEAGVGAQGAGF